ncbi:MAG: Ig-like domain-containing protein [Clostridia bacterium]|nr:Ig-like domain-containing protein [Clostridia bacterium]
MKKRTFCTLILVCCFAFLGFTLTAAPRVSAEQANRSYDFTAITDFSELSTLSAGIDPQDENEQLGYTDANWVTYQRELNQLFTLDNGLKTNTAAYSGNDVSANTIYVRINDKKIKYYKATLSYTLTEGNGWAGFVVNYQDYTRKGRWGDSPDGIEIFIQKDGKTTYSGSKINNSGYTETNAPSGFDPAASHTLTLNVTASGITFSVDGTKTLELSAQTLAEKGIDTIYSAPTFFVSNAEFNLTSYAVEYDTADVEGEVIEPVSEVPAYDYRNSIDFTVVTDFEEVSQLSAGIDPCSNSEELGYTQESWVTYPRELNQLFTLDNGLKTNTAAYSGYDVSENEIFVRVNNKKFTYYAAELVYTLNEGNGWAGFGVNYTNFTRKIRWGDSPDGIQIFVQNNGVGTYSGAKINNSSYTENKPAPSDWNVSGQHKLTLTVTESGITLYADGKTAIGITKEQLDTAGVNFVASNPTFFLTNAAFTVDSFKYTPLEANGDPASDAVAERVEITAAEEVSIYSPLDLTVNVYPEEVTEKTVNYVLPEGVVAVGNTLYFFKTGTFEIKAYSVNNAEAECTFSVKVNGAEKRVAYAFNSDTVGNLFDNYYATGGGAKDGVLQPIENYWTVGDNSVSLIQNGGVDSKYSFLYLKDPVSGQPVESTDFELIYAVRSYDDAVNGWHGVGFVMADRSTTPNQTGIGAFIQEEACRATIWGCGSGAGGVSGPMQQDSLYRRYEWNIVKIRVYGDSRAQIEMYVNDMVNPVVTTSASRLRENGICLFATTKVTISDIYYTQLDAEGNAIDIIYPESITINNPVTQGTVGESYTILTTIEPSSVTVKDVIYTSSNALLAAVSDGVVTFLNAGTVTITARCKGNPSVYTEMIVTVKEKTVMPASVKFDSIPVSAEVGGRYILLVTVLPENTTEYDVEYESSNTSVATVDEKGRMNYVGAGETVITVRCKADPTVKASFNLTVTGTESSDTAVEKDDSASSKTGGCHGFTGAETLAAIVVAAFALITKKRAKQ